MLIQFPSFSPLPIHSCYSVLLQTKVCGKSYQHIFLNRGFHVLHTLGGPTSIQSDRWQFLIFLLNTGTQLQAQLKAQGAPRREASHPPTLPAPATPYLPPLPSPSTPFQLVGTHWGTSGSTGRGGRQHQQLIGQLLELTGRAANENLVPEETAQHA